MSLDDDRTAIATRLNAVSGVQGYDYRPPAPVPGDAWVTLPSLALEQGLVWRPTWTVNVCLPADERDASLWIDSHFIPLVEALRGGNGFPEAAEPAIMPTNMGDLLILEITLRSH